MDALEKNLEVFKYKDVHDVYRHPLEEVKDYAGRVATFIDSSSRYHCLQVKLKPVQQCEGEKTACEVVTQETRIASHHLWRGTSKV